MALATNIVRRAGSARYYVRCAVPVDLQAIINKKEVWKSLGTSDPKMARETAPAKIAEIQAHFADIRQRQAPSEADLQSAVWNHYRTEIEHDRQERMRLPTEAQVSGASAQLMSDVALGKVKVTPDPLNQLDAGIEVMAMADSAKIARKFRERRAEELRKHVATGETSLIEWAADDVIAREGFLIEKDSAEYRDLCHRLQRAEIEALLRADERDRGDYSGKPADAIVKPPLHVVSDTAAEPGETIMELFDRFEREAKGAVTADTWDQNRKIVKRFAEFVGETAHVSALNRKNVRNWKDMLFRWPVKAADSKAFSGMSFRNVIKKNETIGKPTVTPKTINKYLSALGSFAGWLSANDYISEDVTKGMYLKLDKNEKKVVPYTSEQLVTIFDSPLFTGFAADGREHKPGNMQTRDWRFWLPLMGLYTGARLGELAQLSVDDVRESHGVWIFHITREGADPKSTKNGGSMRVVPVHSELMRFGFLEYHAAMKADGRRKLFPEIKPDARGFYSGDPSEFYNGYLRKIGVKINKSLNFHSFRHGMADALRRAGYIDEQFAMLLGHTKASTTGRYGILPEGVLSQRLKMIEAVNFPALDLTHLYTS